MLRRVAAFCRPLRPVLLLVSFPRSRSPVVGVPGLCWMWHGVPFACQRRPIIGVLRMCWLLPPPAVSWSPEGLEGVRALVSRWPRVRGAEGSRQLAALRSCVPPERVKMAP